jgi:N-acetylmuramoyl-L-alanine amidase
MIRYLALLAAVTLGALSFWPSSWAQDNAPGEQSAAARLTGVRFLSSPTSTRVIMDLSNDVRYEAHRLPEDRSRGLPARIYIDIFGARIAMDTKEAIKIDDGLLRQIRVGQFNRSIVRVVLDMASVGKYSVFLLPDPHRLVLDVAPPRAESVAIDRSKTVPSPLASRKAPGVGIRKVVLDPGHGGKDPGAIGVGGIAEKDIVLNVAKKLARKLKAHMGVEVVLTRNDDSFIDLPTRTAIANQENADLFISLHANSSPNVHTRGLETYYLDHTDDEAALRLAARENGISVKQVSDLQFILADLAQNLKLEDSITLAHRLHGSLVRGLERKPAGIKDLGVKKAQFFVLVGAKMPSVLIEMFFISNKIEGRAMSQQSYQNGVADALFEGIKQYNETLLASKTL